MPRTKGNLKNVWPLANKWQARLCGQLADFFHKNAFANPTFEPLALNSAEVIAVRRDGGAVGRGVQFAATPYRRAPRCRAPPPPRPCFDRERDREPIDHPHRSGSDHAADEAVGAGRKICIGRRRKNRSLAALRLGRRLQMASPDYHWQMESGEVTVAGIG